MQLSLLSMGIPLFLTLMGLGYLAARRKKLRYHTLSNSLANISIGLGERMLEIFTAGLFYYVYDVVHRTWGLYNIRPSLICWIMLLILTDFVWYWYHRLANEVNIFWAAHVVHHQSDEFNYTVSARITVFQSFIRMGFWMVLPLLGFPAAMITSVLIIHGIYPFFTHTRLIGTLGILEYVMVTPSRAPSIKP